MRLYFSGVGGVGIGPLTEIALDACHTVFGSDLHDSPMVEQLRKRDVPVSLTQDGEFLRQQHEAGPIDWFVYTSALPSDHAELVYAKEHGIKTSKRDELLAHILQERGLKLIAVAGTHGKTTTTGMLVWAFERLGLPLSYSVGSTLTFAPSGRFDKASEYFVYECDEYDRNFLYFHPFLSLIPSLDYDHPDTYKNEHVYKSAFLQFIEQSKYSLLWEKDRRYLDVPDIAASYEAYDEFMNLSRFSLPGDHMRHNAFLVEQALQRLFADVSSEAIIQTLNTFPGTGRRFEKLADNLYSDYGHHPVEIAATLQLAREISDHVVLVYQPHQNVRQHEVRHLYRDSMRLAETIYWLPTYLTREDPKLPVLTPNELCSELSNSESAQPAELDDKLWQDIQTERKNGKLILVMGAGTIDEWIRSRLA